MMPAARTRRVTILACFALLLWLGAASTAAQGGAGTARAEKQAPHGLQRLWSQFPLRSKPAARAEPARNTVRTASAPSDRDSTTSAFPPLLLALVVTLCALAALAVLVVRRPQTVVAVARARPHFSRRHTSLLAEGLRMNDFVRRFFNATEHQAQDPEPRAATPSMSEGDPAAQLQRLASETRTDGGGVVPLEQADPASVEIGDQVAAILTTAKQGAEQLRDSARQEAERIREEAKQLAASALEGAKRHAQRRREEGDKLRAEADVYSKTTREEADRHAAETRRKIEEEAGSRRSEAEQEAREIHRAARQRAAELTAESLQRQKVLIAEAERSEARLAQLLGVFRAMASQLEELLEPEPAGGARVAAVQAAPEENLDEALKPQPARNP
jgi:hypothetical protein